MAVRPVPGILPVNINLPRNDSTTMAGSHLQDLADRYFQFLVAGHGYRRAAASPYLVVYESPTTRISIFHDEVRSHELRLSVGARDGDGPPFSIGEILRFRNAPEAATLALIQVPAVEDLDPWIEKLAHALGRYAGDLIAGDARSFAELTAFRHREVERYALERALRAARADAEAAWRRKDYAAVVEIFGPLRSALTPSELVKLRIAEARSATR